MKKIQKTLIATGIALATITTAQAQSKFEGFYGQVGVGFTSATPSLNSATLTPPAGNTPSSYGLGTSIDSTNSFTGAISAGYTFAVAPKFTVGLGLDYLPFNGQSGKATITNSGISPSSQTFQFKQKDAMNIYVAPGVEITPDTMAYAKLGYSGTSIEYGNGGNQNFSGYLVGLGVKSFISGGFYGFAEANYVSYGEKNVSGSGPWNNGVTGTYALNGKMSANTFTGLVGVGYKF
jgi:opacity protein-like surface antigen